MKLTSKGRYAVMALEMTVTSADQRKIKKITVRKVE